MPRLAEISRRFRTTARRDAPTNGIRMEPREWSEAWITPVRCVLYRSLLVCYAERKVDRADGSNAPNPSVSDRRGLSDLRRCAKRSRGNRREFPFGEPCVRGWWCGVCVRCEVRIAPLGEKDRPSPLGERRAERIGVAARAIEENGISDQRRRAVRGGEQSSIEIWITRARRGSPRFCQFVKKVSKRSPPLACKQRNRKFRWAPRSRSNFDRNRVGATWFGRRDEEFVGRRTVIFPLATNVCLRSRSSSRSGAIDQTAPPSALRVERSGESLGL